MTTQGVAEAIFCLSDAAACVFEIKSSDPLYSYTSVFSEESYDCTLDVSSAMCSAVQIRKKPYSCILW